MTFERRDIDIKMPDGVSLRGWHYAVATANAPVIVMSHGFGAVKEMQLDLIAESFAGGGFNCIVYDHRCLGSSEGLPRHLLDAVARAGAGVVHLYARLALVDPLPLDHQRLDERGPAAVQTWGAGRGAAGQQRAGGDQEWANRTGGRPAHRRVPGG